MELTLASGQTIQSGQPAQRLELELTPSQNSLES